MNLDEVIKESHRKYSHDSQFPGWIWIRYCCTATSVAYLLVIWMKSISPQYFTLFQTKWILFVCSSFVHTMQSGTYSRKALKG